jgi:Tfp pilus assembly protein PilE
MTFVLYNLRTMAYSTHSKQQGGFTIVELITIMAVIAVLVALTFVSYATIQSNARKEAVRTDAQTVATQLSKYKAKQGTYPAALSAMADAPETKSTVQYTYSAGADTYCLTATQWGISVYIVSGNSDPKDGSCS